MKAALGWLQRRANNVAVGLLTAMFISFVLQIFSRYGKPCPDCGAPVQCIRYADNETNYCPRCQTGGKILADRALSRLLKKDWPRTIEEMEGLKAR